MGSELDDLHLVAAMNGSGREGRAKINTKCVAQPRPFESCEPPIVGGAAPNHRKTP